jgi:CDP-glycerol glycerophosphotransferase (TagB/SpsB family)
MLIIKPHPLENPKNHHRLASKHNNIYVADSTENTSDLIASTDAVISFGSTATFEAIILKKAVIVINFDKFALNPQFVGKSFCLLPKNRSELSNALSQINKGDIASILAVCENARQEFLKDVSYFKSSPSEEITNAICKLIEFNVLDSGINTIKG